MADAFISYCRSEGTSELVRRIAGELESRGISCWYDAKNAAPVDFVKRIVTEIDRCKVFLFLWDEKSNANFEESRSYVRREVHRATKKNVALCPFQIGRFEKSPTLEFYFDFINIPYGGDSPETARTDELVSAIAEMLGKPPKPEPEPKPQAAPMPKPTQAQTAPAPSEPSRAAPPKPEPKPKPQAAPIPKSQTPLAKIIKRGECGDNVIYTLDENGVLTISGAGKIWNFPVDAKTQTRDTPWRNERKMISHVEIQDGVTAIGWGAFDRCAQLKRVSIADSVRYIGIGAFEFCIRLESVRIPDKVTKIYEFAFAKCMALTSVSVPDSVTDIVWYAFADCKSLKRVSVPAKANVDPYAFPAHVRIERRT